MGLEAGVEVGLAAAFLAGLLSLLSPCSVMLLPAFFSYAFDSSRRLVSSTLVFYAGLVTTLAPLGVLAGGLGSFVTEERSTIALAAGLTVIALGIWQATGLRLPGRGTAPARSTSITSVYLLGAVYGLAGACSGPLLGAVLAYAAFGSSPAYGGVLMAVFALGMAMPLLVLALLWTRLPRIRDMIRPRPIRFGPMHTTWTQLISGLVCIAIGVALILTDGFTDLAGIATVDTQFALEQHASRIARQIPDYTVLGVILLLLTVVGALRLWRSGVSRDNAPQPEPTGPAESVENDHAQG